jgi:hypothetical protein
MGVNMKDLKKDSSGYFIFKERGVSIQDLIEFCKKEFSGIAHDQICFPAPNASYGGGGLEEDELFIGLLSKWSPETLESCKFEDHYSFPVPQTLTLDLVIKAIQGIPNYDLSKSYLSWYKWVFSLTVGIRG